MNAIPKECQACPAEQEKVCMHPATGKAKKLSGRKRVLPGCPWVAAMQVSRNEGEDNQRPAD